MDLGIEGLGDATKVGVGATAVVYRAVQTALEREVAVKVLNSSEEDFVRRFRREAKTLGRLSRSAGIVTIHDTGLTESGQPYLLLELCDGSLMDRLDDGPMEPAEAGTILAKTSRALAEAHELGIVHRDVKPANILHSTGRYLLTDFGISTVTGSTTGLTSSVGFTAGYVAPEVVSGEPVGPPADVYGIGASLFHLVTGETAFLDADTNGHLLALVNRVLNDPVPDLRERDVPEPVCRLIEQAMQKSPDDRPDALEMADLLVGLDAAITDGESNRDGAAADDDLPAGATRIVSGPLDLKDQADNGSADGDEPMSDDGDGPAVDGTDVDDDAGGHDAADADAETDDDVEDGDRSETGDGGDAGDQAKVGVERDGILESEAAAPPPPGYDSKAEQELISERDRRAIFESGGDERRNRVLLFAAVALLGGLFGGLLWAVSGGPDDESAQPVEAVEDSSDDTVDAGEEAAAPGVKQLEPEGEPEEVRRALLSALGPDALDGPGVVIPNVIGQRASTARSTLRGAGFRVSTVEVESTRSIGRVVRQSPISGGSEPSGSLITIYVAVADAAPVTRVPAVVGLDGDEARIAIEGAGLVYSEAAVFSVEPAGQVIAQEPDASMQVNPEATVAVYVSRGRPVVPALVGLAPSEAEQRLAAVGLLINPATVVGPPPAGVILSSTPGTGATADPNTVVTVNVSDGTESVPSCPEPVGVPRAEAETAIAAAGCTVGTVSTAVSETAQPGIVISATERDGEIVDLVIAEDEPEGDCPPVAGRPESVAVADLAAATPPCTVGTITTIFDPVVDENRFVREATQREGRVVDLVVAAPGCLIPNVVGMTEADAAFGIRNLFPPCRLQPVINPVEGDGDPGTVVSTSPAAGSVVDALNTGTITLNVIVRDEPPPPPPPLDCSAPSTVGMARGAAIAAIEGAGCTAAVTTTPVPFDDARDGFVISESRSGLTVTIAVGVAEDPPTSTETVPTTEAP